MTGLFGGAGHCVISAVWSGCLAISCVGFRLNPVIGQSLHSAPRLFGASSILPLRASSFSFNPPKIFRSWLSTTSIENGPLQRGAGLPFGRRSGLNRRRDAGPSGPAAISFRSPSQAEGLFTSHLGNPPRLISSTRQTTVRAPRCAIVATLGFPSRSTRPGDRHRSRVWASGIFWRRSIHRSWTGLSQ